MTKQTPHLRTSKKGKTFPAGKKKPLPKRVRPISVFTINNIPSFKRQMMILRTYGEIRFTLSHNKLTASVMDPSNVSYINFSMEVPTNNYGTIRFNMTAQDMIDLTGHTTAKDTLQIHMNPALKEIYSTDYPRGMIRILKNYTIPSEKDLEDMRKQKDILGKIKLEAKFKAIIKGEEIGQFKDYVKLAKKEYDDTLITSGPYGVVIHTKKESNGKWKYSFYIGGTDMESSHTKIGFAWLTNLFPAMSKDTMLRMHWKTDYPVILELEHQHYHHTIIIAPRVENE